MHFIKTLWSAFLCAALFSLAFPVSAKIAPVDLAKAYEYYGAEISPDGKHIALTILGQDAKRKLAVVKSSDFSSVGGADFGIEQEVGDVYWANNERLVIEVLQYRPWLEQPGYAGELFAIDLDGRRGEMIYGYRAGQDQVGSNLKKKEQTRGWATVINLLPELEDEILISSQPWTTGGASVPTVHRLNIKNGRISGVVAGGPVNYADFIADEAGNLKVAAGTDSSFKKRVYLFNDEKNDWDEVPTSEFGEGYYPLTVDDAGEFLFFIDDFNQDKEGLFKLNLKTGERKHIYTDENVDITSVNFSSDGSSVYAMRTDPGYPTYLMFNNVSEEAKLYKYFLSKFPGYKVTITSQSDDDNLWMIYASNDISAGGFYLYNKKADSFKLLFANMTHINRASFSESIPIEFKASDDHLVHGYITYPVGIPETQSIPLVTLVHGGPQSRDYWSFDREVQLLASQGYAVLRVNFRGSIGYGNKHFAGSVKQWGDRVQRDIIDGTKWVISQGGIDQNKVCIMGGSFGGYSAVQSATLAPDLFKCVIGNAGVYDIEMMFEEGDIPRILFGKSYLESQLGTDKELMRKYSPVHNVAKLKAPVLIAHGEKDVRVPIEHAEALRDAMDKHGKKYEWFVKETETHGFFDEQNRTEYYEKVVQFLEKHLK